MAPTAKSRGHSERHLYKAMKDRGGREGAVGIDDDLLMHSAERLVRKGLIEEMS